MEHVGDFADRRHKSWCIHCSRTIGSRPTNQDHVPSKSLLKKPYPPELPTIEICAACNSSFSQDEEYFAAFLGAVLSGTTEPTEQNLAKSAGILERNPALRARVERGRTDYETIGGDHQTLWNPELDRVRNVVVKNARGHVYYELGQPAFGEPTTVNIAPLIALSEKQRDDFLTVSHGVAWPEVGSRMMTRLATGQDLRNGWIVVQEGSYRFFAVEDDGYLVRVVIHDYLGAEVYWRY